MKKLDFPNCIKIYNKTLASDIVYVSELSKNLSNKENLFTFVEDKSKYTDYHTPTDEEINLIKSKFLNAAFVKDSACYKAYRQDGRLMINDGGVLLGKDITLENIMKYSDVNRESIFVDYDSNFRNSLNQQPEVFEKILNHLSKLKKKYNIEIIDLNKKRNYGNI